MQFNELEEKYKELNNEDLSAVTGGNRDLTYIVDGIARPLIGINPALIIGIFVGGAANANKDSSITAKNVVVIRTAERGNE